MVRLPAPLGDFSRLLFDFVCSRMLLAPSEGLDANNWRQPHCESGLRLASSQYHTDLHLVFEMGVGALVPGGF
jgi:hypothetical protein